MIGFYVTINENASTTNETENMKYNYTKILVTQRGGRTAFQNSFVVDNTVKDVPVWFRNFEEKNDNFRNFSTHTSVGTSRTNRNGTVITDYIQKLRKRLNGSLF